MIRKLLWVLRLWYVVRQLKRVSRKGHDCTADDFESAPEQTWRCRRCGRRLGDPA